MRERRKRRRVKMVKSQDEKEDPSMLRLCLYEFAEEANEVPRGIENEEPNVQRLCSIEFAKVGKEDPNEEAIVERTCMRIHQRANVDPNGVQRLCPNEFAKVVPEDPNEDAIVEPNMLANSPNSQCRSER